MTCGQVADFGISTLKPQHTQTMTVVGSPIYTAPEVLGEGKYSEKADVYSFGMTLYEMSTGRQPYSERQDIYNCVMVRSLACT